MALTDVISRFTTGTYTVTRDSEGEYDQGRYESGDTTSFDIIASIQPVTGRELDVLPESARTSDVKVVYTTTELITRQPGNEPDSIEIDGEDWTVFRVEHWEAFGGDTSGDHFRAWIARDEIR